MTDIALFHSVLGVRRGVTEAAERLSSAGFHVTVVDQYDGRVFDDYEQASSFAEDIGYAALMQIANEAVAHLPDGFVAIGFSNGGGMSEYVATQRNVGGVVLLSGTLPLDMLGVDEWPHGVPAQIHYSADDPFRNQEWIDDVIASVREADGTVEFYEYPGAGHLFSDPSLPDEYHSDNAELLWERVIEFCTGQPGAPTTSE